MQELSVLAIMLGLLFTSLAIKKRKPPLEESNLPKIKDPVVIRPKKPAANTPAPAPAAPASPAPAAPAQAQGNPKPEEKKEESTATVEQPPVSENTEETNSSNTEN